MVTNIVIPLPPNGGKHGDDAELRYSLRSLSHHLKSDFKVTIFSRDLPSWLVGVSHLNYSFCGLKSLEIISKEYPDGFFLFYPVTCFLKDLTVDDIYPAPCRPSIQAMSPFPVRSEVLSSYAKKADSKGFTLWDYSTSLGPYWFTADMVASLVTDWGHDDVMLPFESLALSKFDHPRKFRTVRFIGGSFHTYQYSSAKECLVYNDHGNTPQLRNYLSARYPVSTRFENDGGNGLHLRLYTGLLKTYAKQETRLYEEWNKDPFPIRTACEVGVGPYSLLGRFYDIADDLFLVEPCPRMAALAEANFPKAKVWNIAIWHEQTNLIMRDMQSGSYVTQLDWAPDMNKDTTDQVTYRVNAQPFPVVDDCKIDLLNIDCEGCELKVLQQLISQPKMIQVEISPDNPHKKDIQTWFEQRSYVSCVEVPHNTFIYRK